MENHRNVGSKLSFEKLRLIRDTEIEFFNVSIVNIFTFYMYNDIKKTLQVKCLHDNHFVSVKWRICFTVSLNTCTL